MLEFHRPFGSVLKIALACSAVMLRSSIIAAPGDLDLSFAPAFDDIAAIVVRAGGKLAVQRGDGTVAFLHESGLVDESVPVSPGNSDNSPPVPHRAFPYRGFHGLPDARIFATNPPRIINPSRGLSWTLLRDDSHIARAVDGAVLADSSVILARPLTRLSSTGAEAAIDPAIKETGEVRHFVPGFNGQWYMLGPPDRWGQSRLRRLTASGLLDESFVPAAPQCTAIVAAAEGKSYVAHHGFALGYPRVIRLLSNGDIDSSFEPVELPTEFGLGISSLAFDPQSGGVFVGITGDDSLAEDVSRPLLYFIDRHGGLSRSFTENTVIAGSVSRLVDAGEKLYVLGQLRERGSSEFLARIVRLQAETAELGTPRIERQPMDSEVPVGWPLRISIDLAENREGEVSVQWFKDGKPIPGATGSELEFASVEFGDAGLYQSVASNRVGARHSREARVTVSGTVSELDPDFVVDAEITPRSFSATLPDGKILLHASYLINATQGSGYVRLNADGSLDDTFPLEHSPSIHNAVATPDGTIYGRIDCQGCSAGELPFGRRLPMGKLEALPTPAGFHEADWTAVAIRPLDDKILRALRPNDDPLLASLFRFHPDGQVDLSFDPVVFGKAVPQSPAMLNGVIPLASGKILVGGQWSTVNGELPSESVGRGLVRLNADGTIDGTFEAMAFGEEFGDVIQLVNVRDRIAASNGIAIKMMDRDGNLDRSFRFENSLGRFQSISIDVEGRIYISRQNPALHLRLLPNGTPDRALPVGLSPFEGVTTVLRPHLDGMLVLANFTSYDGVERPNSIARIRPVASKPVRFADARLEDALQDILDLGEAPVTVGTLSTVEELRLDGLGITDLRGLENARGLKLLSITDNLVTDLEPLRDLAIEQLFASGNPLVASRRPEISLNVKRLDQVQTPLDPALPALTPYSSSGVYARWETEEGALYRMEVSRDLKQWTVSTHTLRGDGTTMTYGLASPYLRVRRR